MFSKVVSSLSLVKQVNICTAVEGQLVSEEQGQNNFLPSGQIIREEVRLNANWSSGKTICKGMAQ